MNPLTENQIERLYRRADGDLARKVTEIIDWINDQSDTVLGEEKVCPNKGIANCICSQCYKMTGQPLTEGEEKCTCFHTGKCKTHGCNMIPHAGCKPQGTEEITTTPTRIGMLRQYLNEDRKCTPLVTNEDIIFWLTGEKREPKKVEVSCPSCRNEGVCKLADCHCDCHEAQESNKEDEFSTEWMKGKSLSELSKEPSKKPSITIGCGECGNNIKI